MLILFLSNILIVLLIVVPLLLAIAFSTLVERKVMATMQRRQGPNKVGKSGLLQPIADELQINNKRICFP